MSEYQKNLNEMCRRCVNHEMCQGTGCRPKIMLQEMVNHAERLEKALDEACLELCNMKPVINGKLATIEMHKKRLLNDD